MKSIGKVGVDDENPGVIQLLGYPFPSLEVVKFSALSSKIWCRFLYHIFFWDQHLCE